MTAVDQALNGRPGPVVLSIAEDLQEDEVPAGMAPHLAAGPAAARRPTTRSAMSCISSREPNGP